jgi:glutamate-1-semialdehyde aminotransferase
VAGFRPGLKDVIYPIVGKRAAGCRIWDVDGNEYVDLAMGFGVQLFGHAASFIQDAIEAQLKTGLFLGPQAQLAGRVAQLICQVTGIERVCFCSTGTEAVMTALRIARAYTRREKIAMFVWSYHGNFDGTLGRPQMGKDPESTRPLAPGVASNFVSNLLMLDYGEDSAFEVLERHAGTLAAIIVEPVQSLRPQLRPVSFLRKLALWAKTNGVVLIFDEVLTGFRVHPSGARGLLDLDADLVTYGKALGGGLPIGVVGGRSDIMRVIDGGVWGFGNDSLPQPGRTFFAGTFNKNPLGMTTANAVLELIIHRGRALQDSLNERTGSFARSLNNWFLAENVPIEIVHFGSLFRFSSAKNLDSFYYRLINNGVYVWEGRSCFLSTAHGDSDLQHVEVAVRRAACEWRKDLESE